MAPRRRGRSASPKRKTRRSMSATKRSKIVSPEKPDAPPPEEEAQEEPPSQQSGLSMWDFFDPSLPWVLVPNGSLHGHFDFVPEAFRVGPWSLTAVSYLTAVWYLTALAGCYLFLSCQESESIGSGDDSYFLMLLANWVPSDLQPDEDHDGPFSYKWMYNALITMWMLYVVVLLVQGPLGIKAWSTYTVQSWSLLTFRHALCAFAPLTSAAGRVGQILRLAAEVIRFPAACSTTVTFVIWNFGIAPFLYFHLGSGEAREKFIKFCFSFKLVQIHIFNMVFCVGNIAWASPRFHNLSAGDFYLAVLSVVLYMSWYLMILDRIGVHLYPIFSPRTRWVVATWTLLLIVYGTAFWAWRKALWIENINDTEITGSFWRGVAKRSSQGACFLRGRTGAALTYWVPMEWVDASCEGIYKVNDWVLSSTTSKG